MAETYVGFDPNAVPGQRFRSPEVRAEIAQVAPGNIDDGEVTEPKLAEHAVSMDKIKPGAVGTVQIATGGVKAANVGDGEITTPKLAPDSVTAEKAGVGVVTSYDHAGNPVESKRAYMTAAQYAALTPKDPNTDYFVV